MPSAADMRADVSAGIQLITEGQAALQAAQDEAHRLLLLANSKYEEAITLFAGVSDKLDEANGVLRDAIDNQVGVLSPIIEEHVSNAQSNGSHAIEIAENYSAML